MLFFKFIFKKTMPNILNKFLNKIQYFQILRNQNRFRFAHKIIQLDKVAREYITRLNLDLLKSHSTGCQNSDYYFLHRYILINKPKIVIELGSGKSSIVIADSLKEIGGHLFTYEAVKEYYDNLIEIIPNNLSNYITPIYAPSIETEFEGIKGVRFNADLPQADLIFVDGPTEILSTGKKGACLDLFYYFLKYPSYPTSVIVDRKFSSLIAYQSMLPKHMVRYDPVYDLGFIPNATGNLLQKQKKIKPTIPHGKISKFFNL